MISSTSAVAVQELTLPVVQRHGLSATLENSLVGVGVLDAKVVTAHRPLALLDDKSRWDLVDILRVHSNGRVDGRELVGLGAGGVKHCHETHFDDYLTVVTVKERRL